MDLSNLPACAMYRSVGTVIVRIKMEDQCRHTVQCRTVPVHPPSACERCNRTRFISKHNSVCDSVVDKSRPYRASAARSRYVNVCAAVCLVLLVGGLSPQSSAAPHRSTMHRQRRATDENHLWANPCDYNDSNSKSTVSPNDVKKLASQLSIQAHNALTTTAKYKDTFAFQLHTYERFDQLLLAYENDEWLRKFPWFVEEVLPKEKVINSTVSDEYVNRLMTKINDVLPAMYKGLKMIVAGLYAFSNEGLNDSVIADESLKENITQTMHNCRAVLCYFNDIMKARNLEIQPLSDAEVPDFKTDAKLSTGLLLYRDTLNYLEYIAQVFHTFSVTDAA